MADVYQPQKISHQQYLNIRQLRYSVHCWGDPAAAPVFLLHGWADVGMSFQFVADHMGDDYYLIAPDWRGFGDTEWSPGGYWFPDYLADLDELLRHFSPAAPVRLVGHSMGSGVAWLYAGTCPQRVSHAVNLDYIGLADSDPTAAPARYGKWLQELHTDPQFTEYQELDRIVSRIMTLAPRIPAAHARYLAGYWSRQTETGGYQIKADPAHKNVNPVLHRRQETLSCWKNMTAKPMLVLGEHSDVHHRYQQDSVSHAIQGCFDSLSEAVIANAGHMLPLESPGEVAALLREFLPS